MRRKIAIGVVKVKFPMFPARGLGSREFSNLLLEHLLLHATSAKIYPASDALVLRLGAGDASFAPRVFGLFLGLLVS